MSAKPKVICLGLGRTGTSSLMTALDKLGFGPCYHMVAAVIKNENPEEINTWTDLGRGRSTLDDLQELLKDYNSVLDYPAAIYFKELYEAYPDAKFILTTRDPAEWEASMKATILWSQENLAGKPIDPDSFWSCLLNWYRVEMHARYHQGKLYTDPQGELLAHNQRVMQTIPTDKLLVYNVSQGWEPLINFLGVEKPDVPFPHVNDTAGFRKRTLEREEKQRTSKSKKDNL